MLLDEPYSALETRLRAATRKKLAHLLKAEGITTILVTHDHVEALSFADQVAVMGGGRLLQAGTPQMLYLRPDSPVIRRTLGVDVVMLPAVNVANGYAECALGRIIVTDQKRCGPANIMLRPEQISLTAVQWRSRSCFAGPAEWRNRRCGLQRWRVHGLSAPTQQRLAARLDDFRAANPPLEFRPLGPLLHIL